METLGEVRPDDVSDAQGGKRGLSAVSRAERSRKSFGLAKPTPWRSAGMIGRLGCGYLLTQMLRLGLAMPLALRLRSARGNFAAEWFPAEAELMRGSAERFPSATEKIPLTAERFPSATEKVPLTTERFPSATEKVPLTTERFPTVTEKVPLATERFPSATEKVPLMTE